VQGAALFDCVVERLGNLMVGGPAFVPTRSGNDEGWEGRPPSLDPCVTTTANHAPQISISSPRL
jgi:hypothetical protein